MCTRRAYCVPDPALSVTLLSRSAYRLSPVSERELPSRQECEPLLVRQWLTGCAHTDSCPRRGAGRTTGLQARLACRVSAHRPRRRVYPTRRSRRLECDVEVRGAFTEPPLRGLGVWAQRGYNVATARPEQGISFSEEGVPGTPTHEAHRAGGWGCLPRGSLPRDRERFCFGIVLVPGSCPQAVHVGQNPHGCGGWGVTPSSSQKGKRAPEPQMLRALLPPPARALWAHSLGLESRVVVHPAAGCVQASPPAATDQQTLS
jgi:hypothetical protein